MNIYPQQKYCVYITYYSGNKLPPNYIGSSTVERVNKGYRGSVQSKKYEKIWNSELKVHPELFETTIISYHDTSTDALWKELQLQQMLDVVNSDLFVNMAFAQPNGFFGTVGNSSGSEYQKNLVAEGKHIFQNSSNNERLLSLGLHASQKQEFKELQRKRNNELSETGNHPFQSQEFRQRQKELQRERVENGTHHLLSGNIQRESNKKLLESGEHCFQIKCSCIYCKKISSYPNFIRWHGDKCKESPKIIP